MRITESRLVQISSRGMSTGKEQVGRATEELSSGQRVRRPSDDPTAWAEGLRARARLELSESTGKAIARGQDHLATTELKVGEAMDILAAAKERAVMLANESNTAQSRQFGAQEIQVMKDRLLDLLNARGTHGEYIFAGSRPGQAPFDAQGNFLGDAVGRNVPTMDGTEQMTISGAQFTAQNGVDVVATLDTFLSALVANDQPTIRQSIDDLDIAFEQANGVLREIGARSATLESAEASRQDLGVHLSSVFNDQMASDPIDAAIQLSEGRNALQGSQAALQQILEMTRVG